MAGRKGKHDNKESERTKDMKQIQDTKADQESPTNEATVAPSHRNAAPQPSAPASDEKITIKTAGIASRIVLIGETNEKPFLHPIFIYAKEENK